MNVSNIVFQPQSPIHSEGLATVLESNLKMPRCLWCSRPLKSQSTEEKHWGRSMVWLGKYQARTWGRNTQCQTEIISHWQVRHAKHWWAYLKRSHHLGYSKCQPASAAQYIHKKNTVYAECMVNVNFILNIVVEFDQIYLSMLNNLANLLFHDNPKVIYWIEFWQLWRFKKPAWDDMSLGYLSYCCLSIISNQFGHSPTTCRSLDISSFSDHSL